MQSLKPVWNFGEIESTIRSSNREANNQHATFSNRKSCSSKSYPALILASNAIVPIFFFSFSLSLSCSFSRIRPGFALTLKTTHPSMINAIGTTKLGGERPDYHRRIEWYTRIRCERELEAISLSHSKNTHLYLVRNTRSEFYTRGDMPALDISP
ncbi:hypothetical protein P5V15_002298 [Pogonomyrmex californicus]